MTFNGFLTGVKVNLQGYRSNGLHGLAVRALANRQTYKQANKYTGLIIFSLLLPWEVKMNVTKSHTYDKDDQLCDIL